MRLTILGAPPTKKNSQQLIDLGRQCPACRRRAKTIPLASKPFRRYLEAVEGQIYGVKAVAGPVWVKCLYWLPTLREGDLTNYLAASHDMLEHFKIIKNDKLIKSVDGSRIMGKDKDRPRVEIWIEPYEP